MRQCPYDHVGTGGELAEPLAHQVAKPAPDKIASHRVAHRPRHDETGARWRVDGVGRLPDMHDDAASPSAAAGAYGGGELAATTQTVPNGEHWSNP